MPISHGEGKYYADAETLRRLRERRTRSSSATATEDGRVAKDANPNGSLDNIAGIVNEEGTVLGLMPHPERAAERHGGRHRRPADLPLAPRQPRRGRLVPQAVGRHVRPGWGRGDRGPSLRSRWTWPSSHGLTAEEYDRIIRRLGREPTFTELGLFSALWSEHCAYKHSRVFLRALPTTGRARAAGARRERGHRRPRRRSRAGLQDREPQPPVVHRALPGRGHRRGRHPARHLHHGRAAHRHPRLAALRRPRRSARRGASSRAWSRASAGTATASACPNLGGEVGFAPEYAGNPLVNAMAVGLVRKRPASSARAPRASGNPVFYVGAKTGRDGIHGATMASATFDEGAEERRPTVQVGDPVHREAAARGLPRGHGHRRHRRHPGHGRGRARLRLLRDAGARGHGHGGRALAACRSARRAMTPYEIMLSESQERMLLVGRARPRGGGPADLRQVGARRGRDRHASPTTGCCACACTGAVVAEVPVKALADEAPVYEKPTARPGWQDALEAFDPLVAAGAGRSRARRSWPSLGSPGIASKEWVYRQYDQQVGINTLVLPGLRRRGAAHQGHPQGGRRNHRLQRPLRLSRSARAARPWRWRRRRATSP